MNDNEKKDRALAYINKKYGENFEIVSFFARNIDMPYDELIVSNSQKQKCKVYIEENDLGIEIIKDEYYGIIKSDEYKQMIREVLDQFLPEYKYFSDFSANYFDDIYDRDYELKDALMNEEMQFYSKNYIFISSEIASQINESVYSDITFSLKMCNLKLYIAFYIVSNEEYIGIDEKKDVNLFLPNDYRVYPVFKKIIM